MSAIAAGSSETAYVIKPLKPLGLLPSIAFFGVPAIALFASLTWLWPALMDSGMERAAAYTISLGLVNAGLLAAAVIGYLLEGNPFTCQVIPFVAQRTKNTWPGIINHLVVKGVGMIIPYL